MAIGKKNKTNSESIAIGQKIYKSKINHQLIKLLIIFSGKSIFHHH